MGSSASMEKDAVARAFGKRTWGGRLSDSVVLIDDSLEILTAVGYLLRSAGYEVHSASDGMSGLSLVRKFRPKVVIVDVFIPHMSGYEVIDNIRADATLQGVFIIMCTGMARSEAELLEMRGGADLCLAKPVDTDNLVEAVARAFKSNATDPGLLKHLQ